jgi:hypothetical protein
MAKKATREPIEDEISEGVSVERQSGARALAKARAKTIRELHAQPKVSIFVPLPPGMSMEKANKLKKPPAVVIGLNGYNFRIRCGFQVEVPQAIADILRESSQGG